MATIQVIVYDIWRGPIVEAQRYYFRKDSEQPPVVETNVHFVAKFKPTKINFFRFSFEDLQDIEPQVAETNPHFVAGFRAPRFNWYRFNDKDHILYDHITSTTDLQLPIDYFLAGNPLNIISDEKTVLGKLFTTRTSKKGYD